ncbi:aldose 1-epimerase [Polaribacter sp. KT25b]|uniref:aldose 1-epimerase n=1 Tax=Polaribacter sp. KT25b TaxID=1855336 RepID=UPI00087DC03E|nr:aldose 1-epimerase [Polaribacter sp. KT25b]SDR68567.1 aldose 1-epimerase [Polaribacter sp. KT25b]
MYKVEEISENKSSFLELKNPHNTANARISLNEGGRLQELKFKDFFLIKDQQNFDYKDSYASSILFPFASRIQEGKYSFEDKDYQFYLNETGKNALHGLVYNQKFELISKEENVNFCAVTIAYKETKVIEGFPYTYNIFVTYTLFENDINLSIKIKNTDAKTFPFTLGWHPYFLSDDITKSSLSFKSDKKIEFNENLITKKVIDHITEDEFKIEDKQLDDCFILNSDVVQFKTPTYQLEISTDKIENYLQLYTPKGLPLIAIEPMTGISNSFNNKIGLQVLKPNETYSITWNVKFNNN